MDWLKIAFNLKNAVEPIKIAFALSLSKGGRGFDRLTEWVGMWKPFMVRQALGNRSRVVLPPASMQVDHERFPHASTDF